MRVKIERVHGKWADSDDVQEALCILFDAEMLSYTDKFITLKINKIKGAGIKILKKMKRANLVFNK